MKYRAPIYVDTSALRAMPNESFRRIGPRYFTSSLALLEMMTHHFMRKDEYSFKILKSRMKLISDKKLRVDWRLTEEVFNDAFPNVKMKRIRAGDLQQVYALVLKSQNKGDFWRQIEKYHLESHIQESIQYDSFLGDGMTKPEVIKLFYETLKRAFDNGKIASFFYKNDEKKPSSMRDSFYDMCHRKIEEGRIFILKSLLMRREFADKLINPIEGYNYELELFLSASAYHLFDKVLARNSYKRNDMIDLFHLVYVGKNTKILTRESVLIKYTKKFQLASYEPFDRYE